MGLPEILITFQKAASEAVARSSRGMAAILINDDTKEQFLTPYVRMKDVKEEDWKAANLRLFKLLFKGGPNKVLAVRLLKKDGASDLAGTLKEIQHLNIDYMVYPDYSPADMTFIKGYIEESHERGKKIKAVLPDCAAESEHIINFATGGITVRWEDEDALAEYTAAEYCCRTVGILAGLPLSESCTCYELDEVVDAQLEEDADKAVDEGKLIIVFDGDKYKLGRGVTSLTKTSADKPEDLKKIKIVEGMDVIRHDIYQTFEDAYVGKVVNSYDSKQMFVGAVNEYLRSMEGTILDGNAENYVEVNGEGNREWLESKGTDTTDMTDQELKEANTGSWMFLAGTVKFLDAAEDLELQMYM